MDPNAARLIESALAAAGAQRPPDDADGTWCRAWAAAWTACLLTVEQIPRARKEMIRLGIEYGLTAAIDGGCPPGAWPGWSKLWPMIWVTSWSAEIARLERRGPALLHPEMEADRVLASALRILRSMAPDSGSERG